jgi:hypothetical protein
MTTSPWSLRSCLCTLTLSLSAAAFAGSAAPALAGSSDAWLVFDGSAGEIAYGSVARALTIEVGPTDMAYVYDHPWSLPYVAAIQAGETLGIQYNRQPGQLGMDGTITRVTAFYRFDGGEVGQVETQLVEPGSYYRQTQIAVPAWASGEVEVWFEMETSTGVRVWDSDFGRNYHVDVVAADAPEVHFPAPHDGQWVAPYAERELHAGRGLRIAYELERIKALGVPAAFYRGGIVEPSVKGWISFTDGAGVEVARFAFDRASDASTLVAIPEAARQARLWFKGLNYYAGVTERWDANFGDDFVFPIEP